MPTEPIRPVKKCERCEAPSPLHAMEKMQRLSQDRMMRPGQVANRNLKDMARKEEPVSHYGHD